MYPSPIANPTSIPTPHPTGIRPRRVLRWHWLAVAAVIGIAQPAAAAPILAELPAWNGPLELQGLPASDTVGLLGFVLADGFEIESAVLAGSFGNDTVGSTAPVEFLADGLTIAACGASDACRIGPAPTGFEVEFSAEQLALLADGSLEIGVRQTAPGNVRLGVTTLTVETRAAGTVTSVPEPGAWLMVLFAGFASLLLVARPRVVTGLAAGLVLAQAGNASALMSNFNLDTAGSCGVASCAIIGGDFDTFDPTTLILDFDLAGAVGDSVDVTISNLAFPTVEVSPNFFSFSVSGVTITGIFDLATGALTTDPFDVTISRDGTVLESVFSFVLTTETITRPPCDDFAGDMQSGSRLNFATGDLGLIGAVCGGSVPSEDNPLMLGSLVTFVLNGQVDPIPSAVPEPGGLILVTSMLAAGAFARRNVRRS